MWYFKPNVIRCLGKEWSKNINVGRGLGFAVWSSINSLLCIKSIVGDYQGRRPSSVAEMCATAASGTGPHRVYRGGFLDIPWLALITSSTCGAFRRWFKQLWHFSCLCPCSRTAGRLPLCSPVQSSSLSLTSSLAGSIADFDFVPTPCMNSRIFIFFLPLLLKSCHGIWMTALLTAQK